MAYAKCRWCYGSGCLCCNSERREAQRRAREPIFTASRDSPEDMDRLRRIIGADALSKAFSEGGEGIQEVEFNAAFESLKRHIKQETDS